MNEETPTPSEITIADPATQHEMEQAYLAQREKQYFDMVAQLMSKGFTRRNAKRYIESQSRKTMQKFQKQIKQNKNKPKPLIELTPEEIAVA